MARNFDGTNDRLLTANNAAPGLDADQISVGLWLTIASQPSATDAVWTTMTADGSGNGRQFIQITAPGTSGFRIEWVQNGSSASGIWRTNDIAVGTHHLVVTYDRTSTTNDPLIYIDGVSVTVVETATPVGITTGGDTLKLGENAAGTADLTGGIGWLAVEGGAIWTAEQVEECMAYGRPSGTMTVYYPLDTSSLLDEGASGATLTATGTTVVSMPVLIRPRVPVPAVQSWRFGTPLHPYAGRPRRRRRRVA